MSATLILETEQGGSFELVTAQGGAVPVTASSAQTAASSPTFVFRPGGVAGGNVFTTWASLMAAMDVVAGPKWIEVDASIEAAHMTAGAWDLNACTLTAAQGTQQLIIDQGATITPTTLSLTIDGGLFLQNNSTEPVWTTSMAGFYLLVMRGFAEIACSAGAAAFLHGVAGAAGIQVSMIESAVLGDYAHNVIASDAGVTVYIIETDISSIYPHSLAGAGTIQVTLAADSTVDTPQDVTTLTLQYSSGADRVNYVPGVPANWNPAPGYVAPALDQLVAQNFVQVLAGAGAAAATQSIVTGDLAKKKTGNVRVSGQQSVTTSGAASVTFQLLRDAAAIGPAIVQQASAALEVSAQVDWLDTLPDTNNHTYTIRATASAGTITQAASSGSLAAQEL